MTDQHRASQALLSAVKTSDAALTALRSSSSHEHKTAPLETLLSDYQSLLSLIYASTTKVTLSLKPPKPAYSASVPVLDGLRSQIDSVASCVCCVDPEQHGKTLTQEMRWKTEEVVDSIRSLLHEFANADEGLDRELYLGKTGAVHEIIDRARSIPRSNLEAVRSRWKANTEALEDGLKELSEMIDEAKGEGEAATDVDESEDFGDDNGWDELGFSSKSERTKPTEEEMNRMITAHRSMKFVHAMHKRVSAVVLVPPDSKKFSIRLTASVLDDGLSLSSALLSAADELVSVLEIPQDSTGLSESLSTYHFAAEAIRRYLLTMRLVTPVDSKESAADVRSLGDKLAGLTVHSDAQREDADGIHDTGLAKERKWFDACFVQLYKLLEDITQGMPLGKAS